MCTRKPVSRAEEQHNICEQNTRGSGREDERRKEKARSGQSTLRFHSWKYRQTLLSQKSGKGKTWIARQCFIHEANGSQLFFFGSSSVASASLIGNLCSHSLDWLFEAHLQFKLRVFCARNEYSDRIRKDDEDWDGTEDLWGECVAAVTRFESDTLTWTASYGYDALTRSELSRQAATRCEIHQLKAMWFNCCTIPSSGITVAEARLCHFPPIIVTLFIESISATRQLSCHRFLRQLQPTTTRIDTN